MKDRRVHLRCLSLVVLLVAAVPLGAESPAVRDLLAATNAVRLAVGLTPLAYDSALHAAAEDLALRMAEAGALAHDPEAFALRRYRGVGGTGTRVGEVLGAGADIAEIRASWLRSPAHRSVIQDPQWTHAGAAIVASGDSQVVVLMFTRHGIREVTYPQPGRVTGVLVGAAPTPGLMVDGRWLLPCRTLETAATGTVIEFCLPPGAGGMVRFSIDGDRPGAVTDVWWLPD